MTDRRDPGKGSREKGQLPVAKAKQRDRTWDKANPTISIRGIPADQWEEIKRIALEHGVPVGEVARYAFGEFLERYQNGDIELQATYRKGALTLYPGKDAEK
jgi:hypothetical protein